MNKICGLIVTHQPDKDVLKATIQSLEQNVDEILIYDNGSKSAKKTFIDFERNNKIFIFYSTKNNGIAEAQNWLLKKAISKGYLFAVMSDQDTTYPYEYTKTLIRYFKDSHNVAAVCPGWIDKNLGKSGKYPGQYVYNQCGALKIDLRTDKPFKISHAISSGMAIRLSLLEKIGFMRTDLFIDWVDNEWCWRANSLGFTLLAVPSVKLEHTLGDETKLILGRKFVVRRSIRNYYIVRNGLALMLTNYIPWGVRFYLFIKILHHSIFSLIASENRSNEFILLKKAYVHGVFRKLGQMR